MAHFWAIVNHVIREADIVLLVLDARLVRKTRHQEIEEKVHRTGKRLIYVINKADLADRKGLDALKRQLHPCVFVSATRHYGVTKLREAILRVGRPVAKGESVVVGVLGYPNVGKSSVINMLRGKKAAGVSSTAGHTRGIQHVRAGRGILLLDTPGVLPYMQADEQDLAVIGSRNAQDLTDPEETVLTLIADLGGRIEKHYGVACSAGEDAEDVLERIAFKRGKLLKGGRPDTLTMAKIILRDWQDGLVQHSTFK